MINNTQRISPDGEVKNEQGDIYLEIKNIYDKAAAYTRICSYSVRVLTFNPRCKNNKIYQFGRGGHDITYFTAFIQKGNIHIEKYDE